MKLMVLDGNSIANRAFYGLPALTTKLGSQTNAIYGFLTILFRLIEQESPDGICVAFDIKAPTFRHMQYEQYKAQRKGMPEELSEQMPVLKTVLDAMGIPRYELEGYEADDLIGTISVISEKAGHDIVIATGDRDDLQLITDKVKVDLISTKGGKPITTEYTPDLFSSEYGFEPIRMIDHKALMGDSSDSIPGVPGIGQKTADDLISRFGRIDEIYGRLEELDIKASIKKKLEEGRESAFMSRELATIKLDVPIEFSPDDVHSYQMDGAALYDLFTELEFHSLIKKMGLTPEGISKETKEIPQWETVEVTDFQQAQGLLETFKEAEYVSVLTLDGLDGVEVCLEGRLYIFKWNALGDGYNSFLKKFFGAGIKKAGNNIKDLLGDLLEEGLHGDDFIFDAALAAYLLRPTDSAYNLSDLSREHFGYFVGDAAAIYELYPALLGEMKKLGMLKLFNEIELPLCQVLAEMEKRGFLVDRVALNEFSAKLGGWIDGLQTDIYALAGEEFNINSPKQLGIILFEKLMLPPPKKTKTGYSTNIDILKKLLGKHDIIEPIIAYREFTKLKSTYTDGLVKCIAADGRIHTKFQMTVTATGRLSSVEPNLQNIPIRKEQGGEIRKMFSAAPGMVLVDADYSQIELRLLAHISGDETMREAFRKGEDIHAVTASQVFNVPLSEVTVLQRSRAKAVNFGIVYGISDFSLAQDIGVTKAQAGEYISNYLQKYHGVRDYMERIVKFAKETGYVETMFGRRRYLPELKSSNYSLRSFGERVALNMPIQGGAADIMKIAMIRVARALKSEGMEAAIVLQVHDELIVEAPDAEKEAVCKLLCAEMESAAQLTIPLVAEAKWGGTWYDAK